MSQSFLSNRVREKFFQDFAHSKKETRSHADDSSKEAVSAMLCGFVLEGDDRTLNAVDELQEWFFKT